MQSEKDEAAAEFAEEVRRQMAAAVERVRNKFQETQPVDSESTPEPDAKAPEPKTSAQDG
jgi:hypothetical protein